MFSSHLYFLFFILFFSLSPSTILYFSLFYLTFQIVFSLFDKSLIIEKEELQPSIMENENDFDEKLKLKQKISLLKQKIKKLKQEKKNLQKDEQKNDKNDEEDLEIVKEENINLKEIEISKEEE